MDKGVFIAYDDDKVYTYVFHKDTIQGINHSLYFYWEMSFHCSEVEGFLLFGPSISLQC